MRPQQPAWQAAPPRRPQSRSTAKDVTIGCGAIVLFMFLLGSCVAAVFGEDADDPAPGATSTPSASAVQEEEGINVPDLDGRTLKHAKKVFRDQDVWRVTVTDVTGLERIPLEEGEWNVCSQSPAPGTAPQDTEITLKVVQEGESCSDRKADFADPDDEDFDGNYKSPPSTDGTSSGGSGGDDGSGSSGSSGGGGWTNGGGRGGRWS